MICPSCHNNVPEGSNFCPHCGYRLGDNRCPHCGHENIPHAKFCSNCGRPLQSGIKEPKGTFTPTEDLYQEDPKDYEPEKVSHKVNWKIVIISVLVLILATTGSQYYLKHSKGITWSDTTTSSTNSNTKTIINIKKPTDIEQTSNTACEGLVATDGKVIYMSNNNNQLVKLDSKMNVLKNYGIKNAEYLNLVGDNLYYTNKKHYLCVLNTKTNKHQTLQETKMYYVTYHDSKLYYQNDDDNESLYVYDLSTKTSTKLLDQHIYNMNFVGDIIYLTGKTNIIAYNMTNQSTEVVFNEQVYNTIYQDGYLYYVTAKSALGRIDLENKQSETILSDIGYSMFLMSDKAIYFVSSDAKIYRIDLKTKKTSAVYALQSNRIGGLQIINDELFIKDKQEWKVVNTSNTKYAAIFDN